MTLALRAHRLLCRLGLHLWGRKRLRRNVAGSVQKCASCNRTRTNAVETVTEAKRAAERLFANNDEVIRRHEKSYPVDRFNFPVIDHAPRDGVTHEG